MKHSYKYFSNTDCVYFPCHPYIDKDNFNCLFCYCPLHGFDECKGTPEVLKNGIKDCSNCIRPHLAENYEDIVNELITKL
jgi:Zn-finger protein